MSWFDEQIKTRMHNDQDSFENAFVHLSSVVMGKGVLAAALKGERERAQNAIEEILRFYHVRKAELPASVTEVEDILEYLMKIWFSIKPVATACPCHEPFVLVQFIKHTG